MTNEILCGTQKSIRCGTGTTRPAENCYNHGREGTLPNLIWSLITFLYLFPGEGKTSCLIIYTDHLLVHLTYEYAISLKSEEQISGSEGAS